MRLVVSTLAAISVSASMACAQVIIVPQNDTENDINIIPEESLSWEEAANHQDIEVVRPTPDGLQPVPRDELDASDRDKFLQQRKLVRRLDDINRFSDIEFEKPDPETKSDEKPASADQD